MELTLPKTAGWSAMPLLDEDWGHIGAVAKCAFVWQGTEAARAAAVPIRLADQLDAASGIILAEAEMALFKDHVDWHYRGLGSNPPAPPAWYTAAEMAVGGTTVLAYSAPPLPAYIDPLNLFGFEPRQNRHPSMAVPATPPPHSVDIIDMGRQIFRATRRGNGFPTSLPSQDLPQVAAISVRTRVGSVTTQVLDKTLRLPRLTLRAWLFEGGSDTPASWCARASLPMRADTLILSAAGAEVLWRAAFALADAPKPILRRLSIEEEAA